VTVSLRAPAEADADALIALVDACDASYRSFAPAGWEPPPAGSARWVTELWRGASWARVAADEPAGLVGLASWAPAVERSDTAHLDALFVAPGHWRRGIGTRLLDAAVDAMRAAGFARAQLTTMEGAPAEAFYVAQGWQRDGRDAFHVLVGLPAVGYSRAL
jgi:GNAT superfamily N-acetyltransferase